MQHKICLVGSGNWGSVIARIIGKNVLQHDSEFDPIINMWVFEELIGDEKLTKIINTRHENVKYLPGYQLPDNVVAIPDLATAATGATLLIFCIPHQFLPNVLTTIKEAGLGKEAMAVSLIKAIDFNEGSIVLISDMIASALQLECSVLMGANVANEVAAGDFCESTLGSKNLEQAAVLKRLFHTDTFRVSVVLDPHGVEMCGALKNVVALGAGFCDGLDYGGNTKSAILRIGLLEMKKLCFKFLDGIKEDTFFESCGIGTRKIFFKIIVGMMCIF